MYFYTTLIGDLTTTVSSAGIEVDIDDECLSVLLTIVRQAVSMWDIVL